MTGVRPKPLALAVTVHRRDTDLAGDRVFASPSEAINKIRVRCTSRCGV